MKPIGFLHIGLQKTGTTSLQRFFFDNSEILLEQGYYYPRSLGHVNHIRLAACAQMPNKLDDIRISLGIKGPEDVHRFRVSVSAEMASEILKMPSNVNKIVMSNEHIHGRLNKIEEVEFLRDFIGEFCGVESVIIYLRRQDELAVSLYSTMYRAGETNINAVFPDVIPRPDFYDYNKIVCNFARAFGKEKIVVRVFEREHLKEGDLISDFCELIGLELSSKFKRPGILNQQLKPEAIRLFAELNKHIPRFIEKRANPDFDFVLNAMDRLFCGSGPLAARSNAQKFYDAFKDDNECVRISFLPDHAGPLFNSDFDEYPVEEPSPNYGYEDAVKLSAEIIKLLIQRIRNIPK